MAGLVESVSVYGAVCLSTGGLAMLSSHAMNASPSLWFCAGFVLPIGPMYLYLTSDRVMERRLGRWKRWKSEKLIELKQYEQLRSDALAWYQARHRFGAPPAHSEEEPETVTSPPLTQEPAAPEETPSGSRD